MTPIAISNQRPRFVPFSARPLEVMGRPVFAGYQGLSRNYKATPYQPPMISSPGRPQMGQLPTALPEIPTGVTLGVAGAGAIVLSSIVPSPVKEAAAVAGIGLIAYGVYSLFSGAPDQSKILPEEVPPSVRLPSSGVMPVVTPGTLARMLTLAMDENQSLYGGTTRQMYSAQQYEYNILNRTQNDLSFYVGAEVRSDVEQNILYRSSAEDPGIAGRKLMSVSGRGQIRGTVYVPALAPNTIFWPQTVTVQVAIFQKRTDAEPALLSPAIAIKYAWVG